MTFAQVSLVFLLGFVLMLGFCLNRFIKHLMDGQPRLAAGYVLLALVCVWGIGDIVGGCIWPDIMCTAR